MNCNKIKSISIPLTILIFAIILRILFFSGFILCDDIQEISTSIYVLENGPDLNDQFQLRFGGWLFNVFFFKLLGISELSFFVPTILISSLLSLVGYFLLKYWSYSKYQAFLGALLVASAPFEVLIGTLRANDLIFSFLLILGLFFFLIYEKRPVLQGALTGFLLWFAFYTKIWVLYSIPLLFGYYLIRIIKKRWHGGLSFFMVSFFLHATSCCIWKLKLGSFLPFIENHAATYPIFTQDLLDLFEVYPKMIFHGSHLNTTFFGFIPYLLIFLILVKIILMKFSKRLHGLLKIDRLDIVLFMFYTSFFLFLNFFPNTFKFDQYYSVPRIFRYLTPLSFPMTLHLSKLVIDLVVAIKGVSLLKSNRLIKKYVLSGVFFILIVLNIFQVNEATRPGRIYRNVLTSVVEDIRQESPPAVLVESWVSYFIRNIYLKDLEEIEVVYIDDIYDAVDYEKWLQCNQDKLLDGTVMITGIGSCVHYGGYNDGFILKEFEDRLNSNWVLLKEYGTRSYLPEAESVGLWRWKQDVSLQPGKRQAIITSETSRRKICQCEYQERL